jgi:cobalamin biosynthesis protein CobT
MARSRRTLDRRTLREQGEAAERKKSEEEVDETEEEEEDEDDEEGDEDEEAEASDDEGDGDEDEEEEKPKPKKKKAPAKPKAPRPSRARTPKVVRMRVVWGVFNNSHQMVQEFDYPNRSQAEEHAAKLTADKKSGHPFFLQPVKKPIEKEEGETPTPTKKK